MKNKIKPFVLFILLCLFVGGLSAFLTRKNMDIYSYLTPPPLSPPTWVFPVVWSVLYILMGVGSGLVYEKAGDVPGVFYFQLAVNFLWSIIFFNMKMYLLSAIWLIWLIVLIGKMIKEFRKDNEVAGNLQIPYLLWCVFALYLNIGIWWLNK